MNLPSLPPEVDALWVSQPDNVRYLTGFSSPEDAKVLLTQGGATLYTDARYTVQAAEESRVPQHIARPAEALAHAAESLQNARAEGARVGFDPAHLTVQGLDTLREHFGEVVPLSGFVEGLRLRKSDEEVENIRAAQQLAEAALKEAEALLRPGVRELDVALAIEGYLRERGASAAFDTIVASGPRGAMPHGVASDRVMQEGELVTIDLGARLGGYCSDMTRTFALGAPTERMLEVYRAVLDAEEQAVAAVRPGITGRELDAVARDVLAGHGLAEYFAHSLGHGVGLAVHEGPGLNVRSDDVLEPGMIVTVEPGAYLPGEGGVRIEDLVLVTEDGYEVLSHFPKWQP